MGTRCGQHRHAAHPPPAPLQYFVQLFPLVEEHVRRSMGQKLYELFLVSVPNLPWRGRNGASSTLSLPWYTPHKD